MIALTKSCKMLEESAISITLIKAIKMLYNNVCSVVKSETSYQGNPPSRNDGVSFGKTTAYIPFLSTSLFSFFYFPLRRLSGSVEDFGDLEYMMKKLHECILSGDSIVIRAKQNTWWRMCRGNNWYDTSM